MASKLVVVLALVAAVHSSVVPLVRTDADYSSFAYDVADPNTGDFKSQAETRIGDTVRGQYSLLESDGTKRTVDYSAGDEGFNAVVRNDPAVVTAPVVAAAPAVVAAEPAVVAAEAPAVIAARTVVASAPAVVASAPAVYASAPAVVARTLAAPAFYSAPGFYAPSVYAAGHLTSPLLAHTVVAPGVVPSPYVKYW